MRPVFIVFFLILNVCQVSAQKNNDFLKNASFKKYSTKEGLSQRSVVSILQDYQGYLWFGTRYGLNKFDGKKFTNYYYSSGNLNSLSNSWILSLVEDKNNNIWVGTKNGLNRYNLSNDNFERIFIGKDKSKPYDLEIIDMKKGNGPFLWIATNEGLHCFNTQTYKVLKFKANPHQLSKISSDYICSLLLTKNADLWVCTSKSIDKYQPKTNTFLHFSYPDNLLPEVTKNRTTVLFEDSNKVLWLGYDGGLAFFDVKKKIFKNFRFTDSNEKVFNSAVRSIHEDQSKKLWVGCYDGLYHLDIDAKQINRYSHDPKNLNSLSQNSVYKIFEDRRGDLWIGTWTGGINFLAKHSNIFTSFSEGEYNLSLNNNIVSSIIEARENELWIGTEGGGINSFNLVTGTFSYYLKDFNEFSGNYIKAIIKDSKGSFWVGTHGEGVIKVDIVGGRLKYNKFKSILGNPKSLSDNKITCILEDQFNNIWIGTNNGGLNVYYKRKNTFLRIKDSDKLIGNFVYNISRSFSTNTLWISSDNGLFEINVITNKITPIRFKKVSKNAYSLTTVISVFQQTPEILWIGTEGDGLYRYNIVKKTSERFGLQQGLPDEVVYAILPDKKNNIWLSTNNGISKFHLKTHQIKNFNESDGLQGKEFNYGASYITNKGEIVFGGTNGFTIFKPNNFFEDKFLPTTLIYSVNIRNKPHLTLSDSIKSINLNYNQNDISFNFIALEYSKPNKIQYSYKLEGFDEDWNKVGNKNSATYTNLEHGNYVFKVKASNTDGIWNEKPSILYVTINPPLWKTWWAYLIYIVVISSAVYFIRKITIIRVLERNALMQAKIDNNKMEELNKLKLQLFTNISHDFRTPLTLILGPLKRLMDDTKGDSILQSQLKGIYRNTNILLQLINQLLDFRKAESGKLKMHFSKNDFVTFVEDIKLSFVELAQAKDIQYSFTYSSPSIEVWFDKIEIKKAILNILSNAFKFTPKGGSITIHLLENKEYNRVELEIKDTGKGIKKKDVPYIFDQYFQLGHHKELRLGTGVGLTVAKEIVDLHQGSIDVKSKQFKGTSFTIVLPLGKRHINPEDIVFEEVEEEFMNDDFSTLYEPEMIVSDWVHEPSMDVSDFNNELPTLLIVEDNAEMSNLIKSIFHKTFKVIEAKNGLKGIKKAHQYSVDIIISDVMMPKMDGIEFCNLIKTDIITSHIPVILLTAKTSSRLVKTGFQTGADVYISKPFDPELLKLQVENLLQSRLKLIEKFKKNFILEPKELDLVSTDEIFLKKAMEVVEENITDPEFMAISFSEKMFMSKSVLYRKLKAITGQTISEFIRTVKLKKAGQLLIKTDISVTDIAYQVGFNDLKYFRKCFKNTFGLTPLEYRKMKQSDNN